VLARELPLLASRFDYCLIDCPPTLGMLVINALAAAELLIVPMQTEDLALRSLDRLLRTVSLYEHSSGRALAHVVVPTLFDRRTRASRDSLLALRCRDDIELWSEYIPVDTQLREASRLGLPLTHWQPEARGAVAYCRLLDALTAERPRQLRMAG
jgi:chromosome partitioning protein